jgi:hypothetical protein
MEKRKPEFMNGKWYTELLSYGEEQSPGYALRMAQEYFAGRTDLNVLEIGVLRGHNAVNLNKLLQPKQLFLVDPWDFCAETHDNNWADTWYRVQGCENIIVIKTKSESFLNMIRSDVEFDYIYLDGDHTGGDIDQTHPEGGIRLDIQLWWPRVKIGGILAGHDYNYSNIHDEVHLVFGDRVNHSPYHPHGGMEWWVFKEGEYK